MKDSSVFSRRIYKSHIYYYLVMVVICILVLIIALFQKGWFRYCWFTFGLVNVNNFTRDEFDDYETQKGLRDHICEDIDVQTIVESACPNFCNNSEHIMLAGWLMIGMALMALGCLSILLTLHFRLLKLHLIQVRYVYLLYLLPTAILLSSLMVYIFGGNMHNLDNTDEDGFPSDQKPVNFEPEIGLVLITAAIALSFAQSLFGILMIRRAFQDLPVFESNIEELSKGIDLQELISS